MSDEVALFPSMDEDGLKYFAQAVAKSECLAEYGCGGSTVYAATTANLKAIISVDTSKVWVEKVNYQLSRSKSLLILLHCDLGEVEDWGYPKSRDKSQDFWRYMVTPWHVAKLNHLTPDLVLIDGRFRVASFLYSLVSADVGTVIMFDDYLNRSEYFIVEKFCPLFERHGRMGVFVVEKNYSVSEIVSVIAQYSTNWA
jgi:hypothetical protein